MILCPKCKAEIEDKSWFCDQCGFELRYCSSCGKVGKGNRCTSCGGVMESLVSHAFHEDASIEVTKLNTMSVPIEEDIPRLLLINTKQNIQIEGKQNAIIGRKKGLYSELLKGNPYVSGMHARLCYMSGIGWTITDLNSSNGTFIDGFRIIPDRPEVLHSGNLLSLANMEFTVQLSKQI